MDRIIFADAGAFIALGDDNDVYHQKAFATYHLLVTSGAALVTTNHVVDETCTLLLRTGPNGYQLALRFGRTIERAKIYDGTGYPKRGDSGLIIFYSTPEIERRAWDIFRRYDTAKLSYTDCVSFAVMQMLSLTEAFTFDSHFDMLGFQRLPV